MKTFILSLFFTFILLGSSIEDKFLPDFDKFWDCNNLEETEKKFEELLIKFGEENQTYKLSLLTQIARVKGLQQKYEEAHKTLVFVKNSLNDNQTTVKIRYLLERGRIFNSSGNKEAARPLFLQAYYLGYKNQLYFYTLDAAHMMGIVEPSDKQLHWNNKALQIAEESEDKKIRSWLGTLYNNTGWTYHDLKDYEKALELFRKGYKWRLENNDEQGARIQKWSIGKTLRLSGKIEEAYKIQKELEQELLEKKIEQDGYLFEELGECLLLLNKNEEAKKYFHLAYEYLSQDSWLIENEAERLLRLKKLSNLEEK